MIITYPANAPVAVKIAVCIARHAEAHRCGDRAPMEAEVLRELGRSALTRIENAIRHSSDPATDAFREACLIQGVAAD